MSAVESTKTFLDGNSSDCFYEETKSYKKYSNLDRKKTSFLSDSEFAFPHCNWSNCLYRYSGSRSQTPEIRQSMEVEGPDSTSAKSQPKIHFRREYFSAASDAAGWPCWPTLNWNTLKGNPAPIQKFERPIRKISKSQKILTLVKNWCPQLT